LLVIVNLSSKDSALPTEALSAVDSALATVGLRREIRSVVIQSRKYATTYDCLSIEKRRVEEIVAPLAQRYSLAFTVEIEESVSFP